MANTTNTVQTHYRTCNLCEAMCGLEIQYEGKNITSIKGDSEDPFSKGHICPKAYGLKDVYEDKDRLKHPVRRTSTGWEQISWEEAYEEIVQNIRGIQAKYNHPNALGIYLGNPNAHNLGSFLKGPAFYRALKTKNRFSATSVDQLPHHLASLQMFGHQLMIPVPDIDRTEYFLILGGNPLASNGSLMTVADVAGKIKAIQKRGGKVVVVDPRRSETAQKASEHHFILPGSDVLFLLAMVHTLFEENLAQPGRLADISEGLETVKTLAQNYSPERVAPRTGVAASQIRQITRDFAQASAASCYGRMGVSTQAFGSLCQWLINVINVITGNTDRPGGPMFTLPALDAVGITGARGAVGSFGRWKSRVRGLPETGGEIPVSTLAEEILTPGEGQIRAMLTVAGNPVLSTPNGRQLDEAFGQLDFMVAIDIYINETTRHAHIILPSTVGLENDHYDVAFHYLAIRNTAKFSPKLFEPEGETRPHEQIFQELYERFQAFDSGEKYDLKKEKDPTKRLSIEGILDAGLRFGPYGSKGHVLYGTKPYQNPKQGVKLQILRENPHGIDLGPLQPCLPARLFTKNKKIQLAPEIFVKDLSRVEQTFFSENNQVNQAFDLLLIGRRHLRSNNSWMHNSTRLVRGKNRCTLMMHPQDAEQRNFENGQVVEVSSRVGSVQIEVEITEEMMPGVVSIPHGWGHNRENTQWEVAEAHAGASINDLTDELYIDQLSGNAAFSGVPVKAALVKEALEVEV